MLCELGFAQGERVEKSTARALMAGALVVSVAALGAGIYVMGQTSASDPSAGNLGAGTTKHQWRSVRSRHWQIISTRAEDPSTTDAREGRRGDCPEGMVHVKGDMRQEPDDNPYSAGRIETMQLTTCLDWISKEYPERCQKFDKEQWLSMVRPLETAPMSYCIDRYEYPNVRGQYPIIYVSFYESRDLCAARGKRLCNEDEWTFACEGEDAQPYPYGDGYTRNPGMCVTDRGWRAYNEKMMIPRDGDNAGVEMDRLWQGFASGDQRACKSPMGVYDLTGNIDEWTTSTRQGERPSILKGGYWGPVRTRCRPTTRSHDENHTFYQQGFRCCADVGTSIKGDPSTEPAAAPLVEALE